METQPREAALRDVMPNQQFKSHRGVSAVIRLPSVPTPETDRLRKLSTNPPGKVHNLRTPALRAERNV